MQKKSTFALFVTFFWTTEKACDSAIFGVSDLQIGNYIFEKDNIVKMKSIYTLEVVVAHRFS